MGDGLRQRARLGLAVLALAAAACGGGPKPRPRAPALTLPLLDGGDVSLDAYRGRVVALHFFTTYAMDAEGDIDALLAARRRHGQQLVVIGVALDLGGHRLVAPWRAARKVPYLIALASDALRAGDTGFGGIGVPTTVVIDRDGQIVARVDGPLPDGKLAAVLAEAGLK